MENYKAKFMCSYGGKIQSRTDDNKLSYVGGDNKILYVHRNIKFADMLAKLSTLFDSAGDVSFKYQLPGEELEALISVTNEEDLDNMMLEYDELHCASARPACMRLFLFPNIPASQSLNSGPASAQPDPVKQKSNIDRLDTGAVVPPPPAAVKFHDPAQEPVAPAPLFSNTLMDVDGDGLDGYGDDDDEESEPGTLGFVDMPKNQWSRQRQSFPSEAGGVSVYAPTEKESSFHTPCGTSKDIAGCAASSSSSSLVGPLTRGKNDVFISFRGEDTRTNFTCHLIEALIQKQIKTFIDYEIQRGDNISPSLLKAIENSFVSVVVFSKNYASSEWCLEELVKILECRKKHGQVVIPVFYNIDPSHVRKQVGSYTEAFEKHLQNFMLDMKKVQKWKDALTEAADLAGWDSNSRSYRDDFELIQTVVKDVLQKLYCHYPPNEFEGLVGIYKSSATLESLLREVGSVGIWGMGGIGKTTIARKIFDKYSHQYEGTCFLENVREKSGERDERLYELRNQLYSNLLRDNISLERTQRCTFVESRLRRQRNFIVLDDVSNLDQLVCLVGELQSYGSGNKIIITTRDKSVLENRRVDKIYEMEGLDFQESLTLFNLRAFNEDCSKTGNKELSRRAVAYCRGIPLALKVLGSFLHSKSEIEWNSALKKLEKIPHEKIQNVLKLSYYGLDYEEQQIFLDIACFSKGEIKEHVVNQLDSCGFHAIIGMRSLIDKGLITISNNCVWMHDLIQQMGWEIVRQESIEDPEKRSRLWDFDDSCYVLENNKGSDAIRGIMLDISQSRQDLCLSADTFKKMYNLRYLKLFISNWHGRFCGLQLPVGLESFPDKLRYLEWHAYPLQSLPSNFCPEKLVTLHMPNGQFKTLWSGVQNLVNLKEINLANCHWLMELPNFSKAQNLKSVDLSYCGSLRHVHPSILSLGMLEVLNLFSCKKLETLESETHLRFLKALSVQCCSSLKKLSLSLEKLVFSDFKTAVKVSHLSIGCLNKVRMMQVDGSRLENLPTEWGCLKSLLTLGLYNYSRVISKQTLHLLFDGLQSLQNLTLWYCHGLFELPDNVNRLSSLQKLLVDEINVERLPESIKHLSRLQTLSLHNCKRLQSLPELPSSVYRLKVVNCPLLQSLPELPSSIYHLKVINCPLLQSLPELPSSMGNLEVNNCPLLQSLPELPSSIYYLKVFNCPLLQSLPELPSSIYRLKDLKVVNCPLLQSLPELPSSISNLEVDNCQLLKSLPELPSSIYHLKVVNCPLFQSLPELPSSISNLKVINCPLLQSLPELPSSIFDLKVVNCPLLQSLPELPSSIYDLKVINLCQSFLHPLVI